MWCTCFGSYIKQAIGCCELVWVFRRAMANAVRARLGPLLNKVHQSVAPVYKSTEKAVSEQYEKLMKGGEQYVVKDPAQADKLLKQLVYTNLSRCVRSATVFGKPAGNIIQHPFCNPVSHCPHCAKILFCRIPAGVKQVENEWGTVQSKFAKRNDMPLTEVGCSANVFYHPFLLADLWNFDAPAALHSSMMQLSAPHPALRAHALSRARWAVHDKHWRLAGGHVCAVRGRAIRVVRRG